MKGPILFQNQAAYEIQAGNNRLVISAGHGARILTWQKEGREIIRWPDDADWSHILKVRGGNPLLFPFVARHFVDGKNELWRDSAGVVRPMPQHGFVRDAQFTVIEETGDAVRMRITDSDETRRYYPFAFRFDVVMTLQPDSRLEIRFETTNTGPDPLPYYAGHHFYLAIPHTERSDWTLHLPCKSWGRQEPVGGIVHEETTSDLLRLNDPALVDRFQIEPLTANIILANEKKGQRLIFHLVGANPTPWYAVTTWTEKPDSDFFCVEPWLGLPNAIHHGEGLRKIASGETEIATCVLDAEAW